MGAWSRSISGLVIAGILVTSMEAAALGAEDEPTAEQPPVPSAGCGVLPAAEPGDAEGSLVVGGAERTWQLHLPPAYDGATPVPLVIVLHGLGEDSGIIRNFTVSGLADEESFAVVAPLGSGLISRWMWDLDDAQYDLSLDNPDIAFIDTLIDHLGQTLCLDAARIHAAGYSNGAIGVSVLGCVLEDRLAAIAPVAALTDLGADCDLERPVPALGIHGAEDPYVLLEGGWGPGTSSFMLEDLVSFADQPIASWPGFQSSIPDRAAAIAARNGCHPEATTSAMGEAGELTRWSCPPGADVELLVIADAGHAWPIEPIDAGAVIWEFFSRQALPRPGDGAVEADADG